MAVAVQAAASPLVFGESTLSSCSPNSYMSGAFQDSSIKIRSRTPTAVVMCESRLDSGSPSGRLKTLGLSLRRFSMANLDGSDHIITTEYCVLGSHHKPVLSGVDHNAQIPSHGYDKILAEHDNIGSPLIVGEEPQNWDMPKSENRNEMTHYNAPQGRASPIKRRRPPRLEIPLPAPSTATSLPIVELNNNMPKEIYVEGANYAVACKKGRREVLEDAYTVITDVSGDPRQAFFGVFDGHGGRKAAEFAAENLGRNIVDKLSEGYGHIEEAVRIGYLNTDEAFSKKNLSSGTCCVTAMMKGDRLVVANAGDCRAVLSVQGNAEALTSDHKIEREDERQRIEKLGGYVDCHNGVWRVQGMLAVSRSIGDTYLKKWISAEPEIKTLKIASDFEFLILASDGLWDKVGNQEAVNIARSFSVEKSPSSDRTAACRELVEVAVRRGSKDDVTVMIVDLRNFC